jgi:hypothetical protein
MGTETPAPAADAARARGARRRGLRRQLSITAASAAGPYGYTLSIGGSIALAVNHLRGTSLADTLLLVVGAVVAFVLLEMLAQGSVAPQDTPADEPPSVIGNAHIPSAGAAVCAAWAAMQVGPDPLAWALTGFIATAVYFVVTAAQRILIAGAMARWRRRRRGC